MSLKLFKLLSIYGVQKEISGGYLERVFLKLKRIIKSPPNQEKKDRGLNPLLNYAANVNWPSTLFWYKFGQERRKLQALGNLGSPKRTGEFAFCPLWGGVGNWWCGLANLMDIANWWGACGFSHLTKWKTQLGKLAQQSVLYTLGLEI